MTNTDPADVKNRHVHGLTATDSQIAKLATTAQLQAETAARIAADKALSDRIAKLEATPPPVDPPPVDPPPTGTPNIPASIDGTGSTDVTAAMQSWLRGLPSGAKAVMGAGKTYRIDGTVQLSNRAPITIDWNGSTWKQNVRSNTRILLIDGGGSGVVLIAPRITGANPRPGKWEYAYEQNHAIHIGGVQGFTVKGGEIRNVGGDGFKLEGGANKWATAVDIQGVLLDGTGRMGIAVTDGVSGLLFKGNTLRNQGYYAMDVEPNGAQVAGRLAGLEDGKFIGNILGPKPYGDYPQDPTQADGYAFVTTGASGGGVCRNVEVSGNTMASPDDFRWNDFLGSTNLLVTNNERQVKH